MYARRRTGGRLSVGRNAVAIVAMQWQYVAANVVTLAGRSEKTDI